MINGREILIRKIEKKNISISRNMTPVSSIIGFWNWMPSSKKMYPIVQTKRMQTHSVPTKQEGMYICAHIRERRSNQLINISCMQINFLHIDFCPHPLSRSHVTWMVCISIQCSLNRNWIDNEIHNKHNLRYAIFVCEKIQFVLKFALRKHSSHSYECFDYELKFKCLKFPADFQHKFRFQSDNLSGCLWCYFYSRFFRASEREWSARERKVSLAESAAESICRAGRQRLNQWITTCWSSSSAV